MKAIREAMQAGIDSIKGVLDDLRKASGEFADSLKDTIMGFAGLKSQYIQQGAFQINISTAGAKDTDEQIKMITDKIQETFAILAKELAAK
jgi:hypothetical protein